jgi:hypothetical protein
MNFKLIIDWWIRASTWLVKSSGVIDKVQYYSFTCLTPDDFTRQWWNLQLNGLISFYGQKDLMPQRWQINPLILALDNWSTKQYKRANYIALSSVMVKNRCAWLYSIAKPHLIVSIFLYRQKARKRRKLRRLQHHKQKRNWPINSTTARELHRRTTILTG